MFLNFYLSAYDSIVLNKDKMMVANSSNSAILDVPEKTVKKFEFCSGCIKMATSLLISNGVLYVGGQNEIVKITVKSANTVVKRLPTPLQYFKVIKRSDWLIYSVSCCFIIPVCVKSLVCLDMFP